MLFVNGVSIHASGASLLECLLIVTQHVASRSAFGVSAGYQEERAERVDYACTIEVPGGGRSSNSPSGIRAFRTLTPKS